MKKIIIGIVAIAIVGIVAVLVLKKGKGEAGQVACVDEEVTDSLEWYQIETLSDKDIYFRPERHYSGDCG